MTGQSVFASAVMFAATVASAVAQSLPHVVIRTERGDIEIEIDTIRAPVTGANFLRYVDAGHFDGGSFMRTVRADNQPQDSIRIAVIQASANPSKSREHFDAIALERTSETHLHHGDGTISMARAGVNTATSSFFICIDNQPALDFGGHRNPDGQGFAAFGRVVRGMDVVRAIHQAPAEDQRLVPPVRILGMLRAGRS
jgi:peptidyl-prolyl cis-trans isomerase A (cyclophilin A)